MPRPLAHTWDRFSLAGRSVEGLSPEQVLRLRTLSIGLAIFVAVMTGYVLNYAARGMFQFAPAAAGVAAIIYSFLLYGVLWKTGRTAIVSSGIVGGFLLLSLHDAVWAGGVGAAGYAWVSVTPLLAGLIQGQRPGLIWWCVCATITAGLLAWENFVGPIVPGLTPELLVQQGVSEMVGLLVMSGAALFFYTQVIERQTRELNSSVQRLEAEVEERRRAEAAAQNADRAKSAFLATMSHEIRTPMNGVIGMTDLLLAGPLPPEQQEYAETIRSSADTLLVILNDILDLSKSEAGHLVLEQLAFRPDALVQDVGRLMTEGARRKGLLSSVTVDPEVPEWVMGDSHRLRQMLTNLTSNALKFTEAGQVTLRLGARAADTMKQVNLRFEVSDTGIGVAPDKIEGLFAPFVQADSSMARRYGGTGLGLTIVRAFAQQMGGQVGAEGRPGGGSTFWFEVPAARVEGATSDGPDSGVFDAAALRGRRVLVVEDNPVNRLVVTRMLEQLDVGYVLADNGQAALERLRSHPVDAILMDCQMPVMDGYEATRRIRSAEAEAGPRVPIIGLTANAMPEDRARALQCGMDDYLTKPLRKKALQRALDRAFSPTR